MRWNWQLPDWPGFRFDADRIRASEEQFLKGSGVVVGALHHLDADERDGLTIELISQEVVDSSAIEGEILDRASIQSSLARHLGFATDSRRASAAEAGAAELMADVYRSHAAPLDDQTLFAWHAMLMNGRRDITDVGRYRTHEDAMQIVSGALHAPRVHFEAPASEAVPIEMSRLIAWFNDSAPSSPNPLPAINLINAHWMTLQSIFSQSDQCLVIDDPTTMLLDKIHAGAFEQGMPAYFLSRLPASDENGTDAPIRDVISRSFAAFRARQKGDKDWVETRVAAAFAARKSAEPDGVEKWLDRVSGLTGVSVDILREIISLFSAAENFETTAAAIKTLMDWLKTNPAKLLELVRPENVEGLFSGDYKKLQSDQERGAFAMPVIADMLQKCMAGLPFNVIETSHPKEDAVKCEYSRHFVLRIVPDLAFVAGLPARLLAAQNGDEDATFPITLATLGSCVREGSDSPENLAARLGSGRSVSRVAARAHYEELLPYFQAGQIDEIFEQTMDRYRKASSLILFDKL